MILGLKSYQTLTNTNEDPLGSAKVSRPYDFSRGHRNVSAKAMALTIAFDLLIVSWNS
jgi:hypothetical protein